jgi:hypothetical protein
LYKFLTLLMVLLLAGCGRTEGFVSVEQVPTPPPKNPYTALEDGRWTARRAVYQSTQLIEMAVGLGNLELSAAATFSIWNPTSRQWIVTPSRQFTRAEAGVGYDYRITEGMRLMLNIYPAVSAPSKVKNGPNRIAIGIKDGEEYVQIENDAFHISDFTTYWFPGSEANLNANTQLWINPTSNPIVFSNGSSLVGTGIGSAVLYH